MNSLRNIIRGLLQKISDGSCKYSTENLAETFTKFPQHFCKDSLRNFSGGFVMHPPEIS